MTRQLKKTNFERERDRIIKLLEKAEKYFTSDVIPYDLKCDEDFKEVRYGITSARKGLERLGNQVGKDYGWSLVEDELPPHDSEVLVSLDEEMLTLARYHKDKGFLLDINGDYDVKAWCEIPEWYDWKYEEPELTEAERKANYDDERYHAMKEEGLI